MTCRNCGAKVHEGAYLCNDCTRKLARRLARIAEHHADLDTLRTHAKGIRYDLPKGKGAPGKTRPLGMDPRFANPGFETDDKGRERLVTGWGTIVIEQARNSANTWTRTALDTWPNLTTPADEVPAMCAFLAGITTAIAGQDWAIAMYRDVETIERRLAGLVDIAPEKMFAGKCWFTDESGNECQAELYARPGQAVIVCPACGIHHDVAERRELLLREASKMSVTAREAAAALVAWTDHADDPARLTDRIRKWADRGVLEVVGHVEQGGKQRRLFRLGDIQDRLIEAARRAQEKAGSSA